MSKNTFKLWQVREINILDNTTAVVENIYTHQIMIKKFLPLHSFELYKKISEINHPNLMKIYDVINDGHSTIILAEYIVGETLDTLLRFSFNYVQKKAVKWTTSLCSAVTALHKKGIIHRDINPNNVMVDRNGVVKLIDFNISREMKQNQRRDTTVMGTVGYTSPEQFGFNQTDERSDVYSLGVLFNVMLTGQMPDKALCVGYFGDIVTKATKFKPDERYSNAIEFSLAVRGRAKQKLPLIESFFRHIPGFRSMKIYKMVIALIGYFFYFYMLTWIIDTYNDYDLRKPQLLLFIFTIGVPFLLFFDVLNLSRFLGASNQKQKKLFLRIVSIIMAVLSIFIIN